MYTVDYKLPVNSRRDTYELYCLGDTHVGALNCAEPELRKLIHEIASKPNARWVGGGDYVDAVILGDLKRFDVNTLPTWMLTGDGEKVRENIRDILNAQVRRFYMLTEPIKNKCLGLIEGNHEYSIMKHHNRDILGEMCKHFEAPNLSDCAFLRFRFASEKKVKPAATHIRTVTAFICHGHGGGRTAGAEPNRLTQLALDKACDFILTGHSHVFHILPPIAILGVPHKGVLPQEPFVKEKFAANWGSFLYTYKRGPSTYASRANYSVKTLYTVRTVITPHRNNSIHIHGPAIEMRAIRL